MRGLNDRQHMGLMSVASRTQGSLQRVLPHRSLNTRERVFTSACGPHSRVLSVRGGSNASICHRKTDRYNKVTREERESNVSQERSRKERECEREGQRRTHANHGNSKVYAGCSVIQCSEQSSEFGACATWICHSACQSWGPQTGVFVVRGRWKTHHSLQHVTKALHEWACCLPQLGRKVCPQFGFMCVCVGVSESACVCMCECMCVRLCACGCARECAYMHVYV